MAKRLDGRTAVITGAGQGIGRAIVHCFAREGSRVWATSRGLAPLQSLEKTASVRIEQLDVTRPTDVAAAAKKIGTVDILVNCAGYVASDRKNILYPGFQILPATYRSMRWSSHADDHPRQTRNRYRFTLSFASAKSGATW
ncbi:MAG: SDR family NAD(P)-dependent oxidoreductase [Desulfobacterales bacterium]